MRNMTEIPQYLEIHGECLAAGNTPGALRCLDECIARVRAEQDAQAAARLFQYKGNLLYQTGDPAGAEASYQSARTARRTPPSCSWAMPAFWPPPAPSRAP